MFGALTTLTISDWVAYSVVGILLLGFLLFAWRDLAMLVRRPVVGMGTGISRIWAVGRTTMFEAWAGRVWLLPILWLVASIILVSVVRPFEESDRMPSYIRILITGQELMVLVMLWVLASISLPRDRERKIVVTTASKPISRLELILGKMTGFSAIAFILLMFMGLFSWAILGVANNRIKASAAQQYKLAEDDYRSKAGTKDAVLPPEDKKRLATEGALFAYNYITTPPKGMSIVGNIIIRPAGVDRFMKGGSMERVSYVFPRIFASPGAILAAKGNRPLFEFFFPIVPFVKQTPPIQINVTAARSGKYLLPQQMQMQEHTIVLNQDGYGLWEPDDPEALFSVLDTQGRVIADYDRGEVTVTVSCLTPGVFLKINEGVGGGQQVTAESFNVVAFPDRSGSGDRVFPPLPNPVIRGFERNDKQEIAGPDKNELALYENPPLEKAMYRFAGKDLKTVPVDDKGNITLSLMCDLDKQSNADQDSMATVIAYNDNAKSQIYRSQPFSVIEKRKTEILLPSTMLGDPDPAKRGDLVVLLECETSGHWILLNDASLRVELPASPFALNLFKSEIVLFFEAVVLIVICTVCSVRLGWPVAMLTASTCVCFGFISKFIADLQESGGLAALGITNYGDQSRTYKFFDQLTDGIWKGLWLIKSLLPDYTRFDALEFIANLRNMPWMTLGVDVIWTLAYIIPFIAVGYMLIRKQELG